jgi:hypothetical protein
MKSMLRCAAATLVLATFCDAAFAVQIRGIRSCGVWVKERGTKDSATNEAWLIGFLSGMTYSEGKEFWGGGNTVVNKLDNESVYLYVDKYCKENPLKDTADASGALFLERTKNLKKQ